MADVGRPLEGRGAIVTGGTSGIGLAIATMLASQGCRVFICGHDADRLAEALAELRGVGEAEGIAVDLADAEAIGAVFAAGEAWLGGIDIVVLNAAVAAGGLTATSEAELRHAIAVNFTTCLLGAHAAAARMVPVGDLILIGSLSAHILGPSSTVYAGIKAGLAGFAAALRRELGPKGIRVSLVEPGKTASAMQAGLSDAEQRRMIEEERMLLAEDVAAGVQYLLTQPTRAVVQQLTIVPRALEGE